MRKRWLRWLMGLGLLTLVLFSAWSYLVYVPRGLMNGEPFFRGLPASYWADRAANVNPPAAGRAHFASLLGYISPSAAGWLERRDYPLAADVPAAVPVLIALSKDPRSTVRTHAVDVLPYWSTPAGPDVLAALLARLDDDDQEVRRRAGMALVLMRLPLGLSPVVGEKPVSEQELGEAVRFTLHRVGEVAEDSEFLRHAKGPEIIERLRRVSAPQARGVKD